MLKTVNYTWHNWARNQSCIAQCYYEPVSEDEILEIVRQAASLRRKIRVIGSGHSFSPIALSDEVMISLKNFNRIVSLDGLCVTVQ